MKPVIVVGAGLAGLTCARQLQRLGVECQILEAQDGVGGRIRTDTVNGFRLDRGFQVLLTSYPEVMRELRLEELELKFFEPGAKVRKNGGFHTVSDPFRRPLSAVSGAFAPIGSLGDKLRVARMRLDLVGRRGSELLGRNEKTTVEALRARGFSSEMIDSFFRPFFGGVFLETSLETSSRWFELLFRLFSIGSTAVPALGMEAIPRQIAGDLCEGTISFSTRVSRVDRATVTTESGDRIEGSAVVLAVEEPVARALTGETSERPWRSVHCLYYAAAQSPMSGPWLVLNGDGAGLINNLTVMTEAAPSYAPEGQHLVSVTVVDPAGLSQSELEAAVLSELKVWFGSAAEEWRALRTYRIEHALPAQRPGEFLRERVTRGPDGVFLCGDYCETSSIHGAMVSGRKTAAAVAATL